MVTSNLTANDLITLGRCVCALLNPAIWNASDYARSRDLFLSLLKQCNFRGTSSAAKFLVDLQIRKQPVGANVEVAQADRLKDMCEGLNSTLIDEGLRATVILTDAEPLAELVNLAVLLSKPLEAHQEALRQDLVTCLKAHLARPAVVMAWALGYDLVRSWVFGDTTRLAAFNQQLASSRRGSEPTVITDYHDFFRLGEYRFLEICRDSQDPSLQRFTDKTVRDLHGLLDQRNEFAHANYSQASVNEANAYVERLIRIVTSPPFV